MAKSQRGKEQKHRWRLYATTGEISNTFSERREITENQGHRTEKPQQQCRLGMVEVVEACILGKGIQIPTHSGSLWEELYF